MLNRSQQTRDIEDLLKQGHSISSIAREKGLSRARVYQINVRLLSGPEAFTQSEFKLLCDSFNNCCVCCGLRVKLFADHVIPVSWGHRPEYRDFPIGKITNIQPLCLMCNSNKADTCTDYRKTPHQNCLQPLQPPASCTSQFSVSASLIPSNSSMKSFTLRLTTPVFDALTEACAITNRKDPDDPITVEEYAEECVTLRLVELGLLRKYKRK